MNTRNEYLPRALEEIKEVSADDSYIQFNSMYHREENEEVDPLPKNGPPLNVVSPD
jgi:hypothetical protein